MQEGHLTEVFLTQSEADKLFAMEKHCEINEAYALPMRGNRVLVPLHSCDRREIFALDLYRGRIALHKLMFQNRARQSVILVRLDFAGSPHRNPDDKAIQTPHLHLYREGFGDKWAYPVPAEHFRSIEDEWKSIWDFIRYCNVVEPPIIQKVLPE